MREESAQDNIIWKSQEQGFITKEATRVSLVSDVTIQLFLKLQGLVVYRIYNLFLEVLGCGA